MSNQNPYHIEVFFFLFSIILISYCNKKLIGQISKESFYLLYNYLPHILLGERVRERTVLVAPSALGLGCPSLIEVQPCLHPRCFTWRTGAWSSCYLPSHTLKCGTGVRNRQVVCVTHSGVSHAFII